MKPDLIVKLINVMLVAVMSTPSFASTVTISMNEVDAAGKVTPIGSVVLTETPYGVLFKPDLSKLPPGMHGFHLHEKSDCSNTVADGQVNISGAAGGHWDPEHTKRHEGPYGNGHLGDLPTLYVANDGSATMEVLAPRIKKLKHVHDLALMVHAGGDNHSDHPVKLGGGGPRIACGVVD